MGGVLGIGRELAAKASSLAVRWETVLPFHGGLNTALPEQWVSKFFLGTTLAS